MAFSLLDHLQGSRSADIKGLLPTQDITIQRNLLAIALGQLLLRDRQDPAAIYQGILQQHSSAFWQGLNEQTLAKLADIYSLATEQFRQVLEQLYTYIASELKALDDSANLAQPGVSELIQGQAEYLQGQTSDEVWSLLHLPELQGQTASQEQPVDLNASITSLSKMMIDASHAASTHSTDDHDLSPDGHVIDELPPQRETPSLFLFLEPLIALLILIGLWVTFSNLNAHNPISTPTAITLQLGAQATDMPDEAQY
ncbi:hypothetical protein ACF3NA_07880 [Alkanindiges sp. WGS2144]|uniref:hypothetical protein n=1 Tax=Alkanindiges sp. WGS2144 TaxID=3366808 RepID=UPI0037503098